MKRAVLLFFVISLGFMLLARYQAEDPEPVEEKPIVEDKKPDSEEPNRLFVIEKTDSFELEFGTDWKVSPNGNKEAAIEGRGPGSIEEGNGVLVVKEAETTTLFSWPADEGQETIKYVEWKDDTHVYVIVGLSQGTVTKGGSLYELNVETGDTKEVVILDDPKEEVVLVNVEKGTYTLHTYKDDNFMNGSTEEIPLP
ncbi:DUF4652 domain-containing protein [Domibacillus mangrovi]|uniref:DUF4652 domain-containing protein n=1 Tax=Domibacillus mangrovi TaxID=1714354 RepID=A0A1Q5P7C9_9BACI|nr:DUF4652 domain-containing protein [Domibacillus mangrovi]OKL38093.1 hypothetical protein BLL40_01325 [Domibacillus mangrovi]